MKRIDFVSSLQQLVADFCSIPDNIATKLEEDSTEHFEPSYTQSIAEYLYNKAIAESDS